MSITLREFVKHAQQIIDKWDSASLEAKCNHGLINPNVPIEIVVSDFVLTELATEAVQDVFSGEMDARDCYYSLSISSMGGGDNTEELQITTKLKEKNT